MTNDLFPSLVELRQYTLRPGRRDQLVELFAREFIAEHQRAGALVLACFRDLDNPDRFVWLRGFSDNSARPAALGQFYGGELWRRRRNMVNSWLLDSDDVLQLRPLDQIRAQNGASMVVAHVLMLDAPVEDGAAARVGAELGSGLDKARGTLMGTLVTDPSPNNYAQLPLREGEHALVFLVSFADTPAGDAWARDVAQWRAPDGLTLREHPAMLRLAPA